MKKIFTIPRIIAILLLVIAGLTLAAQAGGWVPLAFAALILLIAPTKHAQQRLDLLIKTISNWRLILTTALYESIFWLIAAGTAYFYMWRLQAKIATTQTTVQFTKAGLVNPATTHAMSEGLNQIMGFLVYGLLGVLLVGFISYYVSRTLIWTTITKQKINKKFLLKYLGLNSAWWLLWLMPIALLSTATAKQAEARILLVTTFFIMMYFSGILHPLFMRKHQIGFSFGNALGWGISKVHKLIVPYTYLFIMYVIIYQPFRLIQNTQFAKPTGLLFIILLISWLRIYIYEIVKEYK